MILGVLKETGQENRVALLPEAVDTFVKLKVKVMVESGAGLNAFMSDKTYQDVGAEIASKDQIISDADVLVKINPLAKDDLSKVKDGKVLLAVLNPLWDFETVKALRDKKITSFSLDSIPRTSRAQAMDILSSMATVSGYRAVLDAAMNLPTFFPMFMTAAGTITPAKVLILGAGVAGLQALATSRKLGAQVQVFDVRAAVKEEVMSLGGKFVEVEGAVDDKAAGGYAVEQTEEFKQKQKQAIHDVALKSNVVICTAQIPGKKAPILLEKATVEAMKPGSVVIDLAASSGGNCELTQNDQAIMHNGVKIIGKSDYPTSMPLDASKMFGKNVINFMKLMITKEGEFNLNFEDDIVKGTCITHNGEVINERVKQLL